MKCCRITILILLSFFFVINVAAENVFSMKQSVLQKIILDERLVFEKSSSFTPFTTSEPIGGLSVTATVTKYSPNYLVRILLKEKCGKKRLVLESYETINPENELSFENYCEETSFLDNAIPDSIIVIVKDAALKITNFTLGNTCKSYSPLVQQSTRSLQVKNIVKRINSYNQSHGKLWRAGETALSKMSYDERNALLGISDESSSGGLEYYAGGIFEVGQFANVRQSVEASLYPNSLDWRNRHGKNWMTPVTHQFGKTCTVHATVGAIEAMANLYFNRDIDYDLSEYELICCADSYPHNPIVSPGFSYPTTLDFAMNHGIFDESSYPFVYPNPYVCRSDSVSPTEQVQINGYQQVLNNSYENIKFLLNEKGPLCFGYHFSKDDGHAMVLVGYNTIKENDTIRYYDSLLNVNVIDTILAGNPYIGKTYWILKNSWGIDPLIQENGGYMYLMYLDESDFVRMTHELYIQTPVITMNYDESDIVVEDADGDGYYFWGLGTKPSFVPEWIPNIRDCDDADPSTAIWGAASSQNPCGDIDIDEDLTIHGTNTECNTIHVNNCTVTDVGNLYFLNNGQITMHWGGTFVIDGGVVANAHPYHYNGSKMEIKNGGTLYLKKGQDYSVPYGCELVITEGEIRGPYEKK